MAGGIRLVLTNNSRKERIKKAAEAIQNAGLPTEKVDANAVGLMTARDGHMYVCDPFEGEAFDHLVELGCRIVGPQCVLSCLANEMAVPKVSHPIYSISMHRVIISCSSIDRIQREKLHQLVQWMGGTVSKNFTDTVTHLIAGEVGSKKYHVASSLNTPVMLPDWVFNCWERGKDRYVCATEDNLMIEFGCPVFKGCVICVTGLESEERRDVRTLADENGGHYTGELKFNECTHLIVNSPKGQKYEFARKWKIHCVTSKWFFDSIELGYCQDENLYPVVSEVQSTSTPNTDEPNPRLSARPSMANFSAISNVSMPSAVDDTAMTEANDTLAGRGSHNMRELDELDLTLADGSLFLDGSKVFLSGFSGARLEKLRKIINSGGATRFNQINESVSHVVMGDRVPEHVALLTQSSFRPCVVSAAWLVDSFKQGTLLPEEPYTCLSLPPVASASPVNRSKSEKPRQLSVSAGCQEGRRQAVPREAGNDDDADMMQQYLPGKSDPNETTGDSEIVFNVPGEGGGLPSVPDATIDEEEDETQMEEGAGDDDVTMLEEHGVVEGIFSGKSFVILGFPPEQEEQILEMTVGIGGRVKSVGAHCVADFAVVPINGCEVNVTVREVVTNCWLQMCLEEDAFLPPDSNPLFAPISTLESDSPLSNCVLTVSQFSGVERDCLVHIAELLGATCQEYFSRKATGELKPNTHLLLREASGSKYKAAKKWRVPAVTKDWLLDSAKENKRQPEKRFLVDSVTEGHAQDQGGQPAAVGQPEAQRVKLESDTNKIASAGGREDVLHTGSRRPVPAAGPTREDDPAENRAGDETPKENVEPDDQKAARTNKAAHSDTHRTHEQQSVEKVIQIPPGNDKENRQGVAAQKAPLDTPVVNKYLAAAASGAPVSKDTPSKFIGEGVVFHPAFDTKDALDYLESPAGAHHKKRHARKSSLPLDDFFHLNIAKAIQKTGEQAAGEDADDTVFQEQAKTQGVLDGLVICVSKKLIAKQGEYHVVAASLGAEFRWTFDNSCTHFIFKGRTNDTSKEYRAAKDKGMFIVSPLWLLTCEEEERRVDEASYPHTFNPKMSLSVLSTKHETPSRTTRQTRSMARTPRAPRAPPPARTPKPHPPPPPPPSPPLQHDETAMDGFEDGSADSDEELLRMVEAAERGEGVAEEGGEGVAPNANEEGSLEQRENLQKQLEGIMSSTTNSKGGRRRSRLHKSSTSSVSDATSASSLAGRDRSSHRAGGRHTRSGRGMVHGEEDGQAGPSRALAGRPPEVHHEASQNVQITWDDPTGRMEREKIMAQLKRDCSPSRNSAEAEEGRDGAVRDEVSPDKARVSLQEPRSSVSALHREDSREELPSPTPRAPPIRLPVANPPVAPQPVVTKVAAPEPEVGPKPQPKFQLSGMSQEEKIDYSALIEQLGGVVKDGMFFDPSCTHLVVGNPARNEKYLASLATGKWVLHKSYFEACRQEGEFVEEEAHEWGSATDLSILNAQTVKMATAACRWRQQLQNQQQRDDGQGVQGAFSGWSVVLYIDRNKETSFKRILLAGGARVLGMRPPFSNLLDITHAFMDLQKTKTPDGALDLGAMATAGVLCLKPEYISEFLLQDPVPDHANYFINEIRPIMQRLQDPRQHERTPSKRKRQDNGPRSTSKKGRVR